MDLSCPERLNRRSLLVAGATIAVAGTGLRIAEANANEAASDWVLAVVKPRGSAFDLNVVLVDHPDQAARETGVDLKPGAAVTADLVAGEAVLIEGGRQPDGSIAADRVIEVVLGKRSDIKR